MSESEKCLKVKSEISVCAAIVLNDHSSPYIESTTVLSHYFNRVRDSNIFWDMKNVLIRLKGHPHFMGYVHKHGV